MNKVLLQLILLLSAAVLNGCAGQSCPVRLADSAALITVQYFAGDDMPASTKVHVLPSGTLRISHLESLVSCRQLPGKTLADLTTAVSRGEFLDVLEAEAAKGPAADMSGEFIAVEVDQMRAQGAYWSFPEEIKTVIRTVDSLARELIPEDAYLLRPKPN